MKRVSVIPEFGQPDFILGLLILLIFSWGYLFLNARRHRRKYHELRYLALEKVKSGEVKKEKVEKFLKTAHLKVIINRYLLMALLFIILGLLYYSIQFYY